MSLTPLKCKLCNTIIQEPPIIVGEDLEMRQAKAVTLIHQHFDQAVMKEMSQKVHPVSKPVHLAAMEQGIMPAMMTAQTWLKMGHFELPDYLQEARDRARRNIAGATRKIRMSDEDLREFASQWEPETLAHAYLLEMFRDLRDRYEEIGKYAPATKQPEKTPELVKP